MSLLSLIRNHGPDSIFAFRAGRPIRVAQFLDQVQRLAAMLPDRQHMLNLCTDRYHFLVGFSAALVRRQINLLPPNHTPSLIAQLERKYPDLYCLADEAGEAKTLETFAFPELPSEGCAPAPAVPSIPATQLAAIAFTSGSTGEPVAHQKSWGSLVDSAQAEAERLSLPARPAIAFLGTVPPQHMYGLETTLLLPMQSGHIVHASQPFYPAEIRDELGALERPRCLVTTPVHLRALLEESAHPPPVDLLICATATLSPQLAASAEIRFGAPLIEIYGCTEAGQIASRRTTQGAEWQPLRGVTLRQDEAGAWASGGHIQGEVLLADVIELRHAGSFLLHGRTADLVNIAGKRTSLANLNYHLNSIEGVVDGVFVLPEGDNESVSRLIAFVVAPRLGAEALLSALRQRIDAAFLPRPLCLVEQLPRNATGKLPRQVVNELVKNAPAG
jgi:acyl-coenzyme A synthetase/AMP-(fatty) acid ligase